MKKLLLAVVVAFSLVSFCYALETDTHKKLNEYIAQNEFNGFSLNVYLQNQLGMKKGAQEVFNNKAVFELLGDGGEYEDKPPEWYSIPYLRSLNHFHNPLTDQGYGIGASAILWSQKLKESQFPGGYYSWHDAHGYYYNALTSPAKSDRDTNFASTFKGLGQLMHLVQDIIQQITGG